MPFLALLRNTGYVGLLGPRGWYFVSNSQEKQGTDTASMQLPGWTFVSQLQY